MTFFSQQVSAQEAISQNPPTSEWQFGTDLFQMLFRQRGLGPENDFRRFMAKDPEKCVLVISGNMRYLSYGQKNDLYKFIDNGGALLIASDRGNFLPQLCTIHQGPITVRRQDAYLNYFDCPLMTDLDDDHRLTLGVNKVVANRCGYLSQFSSRHGEWTKIARLPETYEPVIAAMQSHVSERGRLVVTADHSLFINGMLWHGDNALLAVNISNWLCEGGRQHVLFLEDGRTQITDALDNLPPPETQKPDVPENMPDLPAKSLLTFANSFLTGLEDTNVLNDMAAGQPRNISDRTYHRALLLFAAAVVGLITLYKLRSTGPHVPVPPTRTATPIVTQRLKDLKSSGNLRPLCQELASELMQDLTGSLDQTNWIIKSQQVVLVGNVKNAKHIRNDIQRISLIATDIEKFTITNYDFDQLAKKISCIRRLLHEEKVELRICPEK